MAKDARLEFFYHPVMGAQTSLALGISLPRTLPLVSSLRDEPRYYQRNPMTLSRTAVCAVTGEILPTSAMIRFVIAPDQTVIADLTQKLPGIFLWVKADRHVLQKAIRRNSFTVTARQTVKVPENLLESIENGLKKLSLQTLSMAKRAGELLFGFTKVDEALRSHSAAVYVVASNAKENGREKLERLANVQSLPVIDVWNSADLSAAIGEENIIHLVLSEGGLTQKLLELVTKLKAVKSET